MRARTMTLLACALLLGACGDTTQAPPGSPGGPSTPGVAAPDDGGDDPATPGDQVVDPGAEAPGTVTDPGSENPPAPAQGPQSGLLVRDAMQYPTRLAEGPDGRIWVSDARLGAVFALSKDLSVIGELKGVPKPLGVAVGADGRIFVGSHAMHAVLVYSKDGELETTIGSGAIGMPNALSLDRDGLLYIADSTKDVVRVYKADGTAVRTIGESGDGPAALRFPAAVRVVYRTTPSGEVGELWVADQGHFRVQVYDLAGTLVRSFGQAVEAFSDDWKGRFVKLQGLAVDATGMLHAVDSYQKRVQVLEPEGGAFVESYAGPETGLLSLPLDILVTKSGQVLVANAESRTVESLRVIAAPTTEGE